MLTSPIQFFPLFLCSKSPLHHLFKIGKANRTQKLLIIYVFLGIKCVWDFLVSVIVISSDSWFQYRYLCLSFKHPPLFFCTVPRSKSWLWMCQELSNKLSVYWIKLLRNQYLYIWKGIWLCYSEWVWFTWTQPVYLTAKGEKPSRWNTCIFCVPVC